MATGAQVVESIDTALRLNGAGARYWRDRLINARVIHGRQGPSPDTPLEDVALILIGILIGPAAISRPDIVKDYAALRTADGGAFGTILAAYLADPHDLLELVVDNSAPAAAVRHLDHTGNVVESLFLPPEIGERPSFTRLSCVPANAFTALSESISRNAPPSIPRRRRRRRHHA